MLILLIWIIARTRLQTGSYFVQLYDFNSHKTYKPIRITNDSVADSMPQLVRRGNGENASTNLFWLQNDKVVRYIDLTDLIKNGIEADGTISADYELTYGTVSMTSSLDDKDMQSLSSYKAAVDNNGNMYIIWQETVMDLKKILPVWNSTQQHLLKMTWKRKAEI